MTVCVAALGTHGANLVLASDRMISGVAQYQTTDPKVVELTRSIVVMWSGNDAGLQALIHDALRTDVQDRFTPSSTTWPTVSDIAFLYQEHYNAARRHRAEQAVLAPYGFTTETFTKAIPSLDKGFVTDRLREMRTHPVEDLAALIVGMDLTARDMGKPSPLGHIFKFEAFGHAGTVSCEDAIGFAAIGAGDFHAVSALMNAGHGPSRPLNETVLNVYVAKKRGEAAPGVGEQTDMFFFSWRGGRPGLIEPVAPRVIEFLDQEYSKTLRTERKAITRLQLALNEYVEPRPPAPAQIPPPSGGPPTAKPESSEPA